MKTVPFTILIYFILNFIGCTLPQVIQPLRLYDLKDGSIIEVILHPTSRDHGKIVSSGIQKDQFEGEYVIYDRITVGSVRLPDFDRSETAVQFKTPPTDWAELYGFGKNSNAHPVGTGVIVGKDGTVIEIVFYRFSSDYQTGDGVAKDNKGKYYRIFLSTENQ